MSMCRWYFSGLMRKRTAYVLGIVCLCSGICRAEESSPGPERWPGFLGVGATVLHPETLPLEWSPETNISWQAELVGTGQSSPVIWGDKVFVTTIYGTMKEDCHVTALSLADGRKLWDYKTESAQPVRSTYTQSRSAPTPAVDADGVYAFFETGKLVGLSHAGQEKWTRNLVEEFGEFEIQIGLASSVAQTAESVFVLVDHEGPSYLLAVDKKTGETRWQTERFSRHSYTSPIVLEISGESQIVISSDGSVDGYDPATGAQLWTLEGVGGNRSTTPLPFGDNRFLISASPGMHDEHLDQARESNLAMQIVKTAAGYEPRILWKAEKAMPSFGSPMVYQGLAYWVNSVGVVFCYDAETGEQVYAKRSGQLCWATPLGLGDHIYLFGKDGLTTVIQSGREFNVVAKNELFEGATEAGAADVQRRESRGHGHGSGDSQNALGENRPGEQTQVATVPPETTEAEKRRASGRPERSGADNKEAREEGETPRLRGGRTFADPVQYGYAAVNGSLIIRTGGKVYCLRKLPSSTAVNVAPGLEATAGGMQE